MVEMISISMEDYEEYLQLKRDKDEVIEHVDLNLQALKEGKVYDL